uniref:DDE Tnp4 domain-containing protein n=1 Tax=Brassica oleracea var. oleracea TaxID=109376 RepID=A0A0D3AZW9_BRAOL
MDASSSNNFYDFMDEKFDQIFDQQFDNLLTRAENRQEASRSKKKRAYIERQREQGHIKLWNDYFSEDATYPSHMFRRRFRMNKSLFMRIVNRLSAEISYFQQRRDATGRFGLSPLQKATAAIRMMAYGCPADAVDEYLRLGETTAHLCLEHFVQGIINLFGDEYLRRPTPEDLQRLLDIGELRGFLGMIGSIDCRAPKVNYTVNGHEYRLAYYLTDGIYPKWTTFVQSIPLPQGPKASLFATHQEAFVVVSLCMINLKSKMGLRGIMKSKDERDGYTQFDVSVFKNSDSNRSSEVDFSFSTDMPSNLGNRQKFGTNQDFN